MTSRTDRFSGRAALVVSIFALVVALGGTSYAAAKISGSQIKSGTITSTQVKDRSLLAKDFKAGQLPRGATGARGLQGVPGAAGPGTKLLALGTSGTSTQTQLAQGLTLDWECNPGTDAILQFPDDSGDVLWTGTIWEDGAVHSQTFDQNGLVLGELASQVWAGFSGTVRNATTGKSAWIDAVFKMDASTCKGRAAYTPLQ